MHKFIRTAILSVSLISGAVLLSTPLWAANATSTTTATSTAPVTSNTNPIIFKLTQKLDLTQAQKDQIKAIIINARPTMDSDMQQLMANDRALHDAMNSDDYDLSQIKKLANQKGNLIAQMTLQRAQMHHQIMAVLTPTQKTELKQLMEEKREQWRAKHQQTA